jgi:indole-3-glycerol phosphate synthase/phosphoribosylanthranilate isomerase/anthranilate synthase/indole-3-glycerol phosphate synthase/phosphoribosylanthranilate isomerase
VVIAEIKAASPSAGVIRPSVDPVAMAQAFQDAGAGALSVLTDARFFGGSWETLAAVCRVSRLPVLCKEVIIDPVQIDDAAAAGAAAVLLMASVLDTQRLRSFRDHARRRGLDALVEVHTPKEVAAALAAGADLVGINNRDLRTLEVDLETTARLRPLIPAGVVVVSESGLQTREQVVRMERLGVDAVLVGTSLMASADPAKALRALRGAP